MRLTRLFSESDDRIRALQKEVQESPNDPELFDHFIHTLKRMGIDEDSFPLNDEVMFKCADHLEREAVREVKDKTWAQVWLGHPLEGLFDDIEMAEGLEGMGEWERKIQILIGAPGLPRFRTLRSRLYLYAEIMRSIESENADERREAFSKFWYDMDLNYNDLVRIVYL